MKASRKKSIGEILGRDPVHPFPARMAPDIALDAIASAKGELRVFDPMMGSGTVLAVARSQGHRAFGTDLDPLAVLIARVWTTAIDPEEVRDKAAEVLARARLVFTSLKAADAYPLSADEETRKFAAYWFDAYARKQLAALAISIHRVRDAVVRDALWCSLSRLIITKQAGASLALDLAHSRPHKHFQHAPTKPFNHFLIAVERVVKNCISRSDKQRGPAACPREGDARSTKLASASVDLVVTSPPYLNAIDYLRCSKFSLVWMGHSVLDIGELRTRSVGSEAGLGGSYDAGDVSAIIDGLGVRKKMPLRQQAVLARYVSDMHDAVAEVGRVLVPGGSAIYVVGENTVRGTYVRNSAIVSAVADLSGLSLSEQRVRVLPDNRRYLPPPTQRGTSDALHSRMRREVVLSFTRRRAA
jgi:DNA modification methylase